MRGVICGAFLGHWGSRSVGVLALMEERLSTAPLLSHTTPELLPCFLRPPMLATAHWQLRTRLLRCHSTSVSLHFRLHTFFVPFLLSAI